jgi:integrase/recombinase XerD
MKKHTLYAPNSLRGHSVSTNNDIQVDIPLNDAFNQFIFDKEIQGLRERTLTDHRIHFQYFQDFLSYSNFSIEYIQDITPLICKAYIVYMKNHKVKWDNHKFLHGDDNEKGLSPVTINIRLRTLKAQFNYYLKEGFIIKSPWDSIPLLKTDKDYIQSFTKEDVNKILEAPNIKTFVGFRNLALIYTLLDCGLRNSELVGLNEWDLDYEQNIIYIGAKRSKPRSGRAVPITEKTSSLLNSLLKENSILKDRAPAIFISVSGKRLDTSDIRRILKEYGKKAGIKNVRTSPHTFRHTFAKFYILNGGDAYTLQKILGHSTLEMTRKYIQMNIGDLKKQHELFSPANLFKQKKFLW